MEFRGWRRYSLYTTTGGISLRGSREEWDSPVKTAVCIGGVISECPMETDSEFLSRMQKRGYGEASDIWHGCGVHSFKTLGAMLSEDGIYTAGVQVLAEVVNYGRVDEFENGYRAEHTRILKMYLIAEKDSQADYLEALRRILETRFGVHTLVASMDDLIAEHAPDWKPKHRIEDDFLGTSISSMRNQMWQQVIVSYAFGGNQWQTSASASSGTTTSPNRSQRRSGNPSQSKNQSPSAASGFLGQMHGLMIVDEAADSAQPEATATKPTKKKPVEAKLPGNQKKWWLNR